MQATFSHQPTNTPTQTKTHPHTPIHTDKHNNSHTHAHKHRHFQTCAHTLSPSVALIIHSSRCFTIIITMTSMPAPAAATVQNSGQKSLERMNELVWDQVWHFHAFFSGYRMNDFQIINHFSNHYELTRWAKGHHCLYLAILAQVMASVLSFLRGRPKGTLSAWKSVFFGCLQQKQKQWF